MKQSQNQDHHGNHDPEAAVSEDNNVLSGSNHETSEADNDNEKKKKSGEAPRSMNWRRGLNESIPLTHSPPSHTEKGGQNIKSTPQPRLLHPWLLRIPMQVRFGVYGTLSSALFMLIYNAAVYYLDQYYVPSTIYATVYMIFIPIQHAMASSMVFGWPDRYIASLMSNVPIGLTAIALGAYLTAYLDKIKFNESAEDIIRSYGLSIPKETNNGEFYSSMFVLVVTSFWTFVLTVLVNSPTEESEKKQL